MVPYSDAVSPYVVRDALIQPIAGLSSGLFFCQTQLSGSGWDI
jgi:hypothetical protein